MSAMSHPGNASGERVAGANQAHTLRSLQSSTRLQGHARQGAVRGNARQGSSSNHKHTTCRQRHASPNKTKTLTLDARGTMTAFSSDSAAQQATAMQPRRRGQRHHATPRNGAGPHHSGGTPEDVATPRGLSSSGVGHKWRGGPRHRRGLRLDLYHHHHPRNRQGAA